MCFGFCFCFLVGISVGAASFAVELKISAITAEIERYNAIIKKKRKKHNEIVLLAKTKLKYIEVLISNALINSNFI